MRLWPGIGPRSCWESLRRSSRLIWGRGIGRGIKGAMDGKETEREEKGEFNGWGMEFRFFGYLKTPFITEMRGVI